MAFASDSTTAPARPLLPLSALDRRAIGRDGWARARELAARLGGAVRDHLAEGLRQAWAAARGLLQTAASAPAANDASALASESVAAASAVNNPAHSRSVDQVGTSDLAPSYPDAIGVAPPLLPLPAPLPPLTAALSRRRAIFGAVTIAETHPKAGLLSFEESFDKDLNAARAIHLRRQLEAAAEHGADLLAVLGLPQLAALDHAIATLDAVDGDPDLEDDDPAEAEPDELSLGWPEDVAARMDPTCAADPDAEHDDADLEEGDDDEDRRAPWPVALPPWLPAGEARP